MQGNLMTEIICTVTPTILDGTVIRYFANTYDPKPLLSASRNGVHIKAWLHEMATHRRIKGKLVKIERGVSA